MVVTVDSPIGALRLIGPAFRLSATPPRVRSAPPTHGQHTDEVLALVGYTPEQITTLRNQGAV
jgi:crotonobetainyl-CoA:carnitine CoA-transferase CaiB-like acyl-CoA transferase